MDLRQLAKEIRKLFGIERVLYFPIIQVLELIHLLDDEAHFEIVDAAELEKGEHAVTDITTKTILIREDVYEGACRGNGRDRMTIAHEFAHFITLCVCGFRLARRFDNVKIPSYQDPEWQAKCLAGELMIDCDLIKGLSVDEITEKCGVSLPAAKYQLSKV